MSKESFNAFWNKNGPKILTAFGIGNLIGAVTYAIKSTPKAMKKVDKLKEDVAEKAGYDETDVEVVLTKKEIVQETWKCYIPTIVMTAGSITCFILAESIYWKQGTVAAAAYEVAKTSLKEYKQYKEAVVEEVGDEVEGKIRDRLAQKKIEETEKPEQNSPIYILADDEITFYLDVGDSKNANRYFKSSANKVGEIFIQLNNRLNNYDDVTLDDMCAAFGVKSVEFGDIYGWRTDVTGLINWDKQSIDIDGFHPGYLIYINNKPVNLTKYMF